MGSKRGKESKGSGRPKRPAPRSRSKPPSEQSSAPTRARQPNSRPRFPIVGIGASAGGLQALRRFFDRIPEQPGIAFVVVQHLDPDRKSETAELLRPHCPLPVVQLSDKQPVEADRVYVIPPNRELTIRRGVLRLTEPADRRGFRTPIDGFLRSLADDQNEWAVAIILTGTGADGTLGVKAVKAAGGLTMAQDPDTAEYDGMPRSAVATGLVDFVLPVHDLPRVLLRYVRHPYLQKGEGVPSLSVEDGPDHFQAILALLRARTKYDFSSYKSGTISRRIERRMSLKHLHRIPDYVKHLQDHPAEVQDLFKDLLISVTSFFREPRAWESLKREVIPRLVEARAGEGLIRVWVPGCATGEEAYSLAMLILEQVHAVKKPLTVQVFASDLDAAALEFARAGVYPESIAADVSPERLRRFFVKADHSYEVSKEVRDVVVFALQNLIGDPPFSKLDLISCRNLMIYLAPEIHGRVISLFHFALRPDGYLCLGNAESIGSHTDLFEPVSKKWRIYRRIGPARHDRLEFPIAPRVDDAAKREAPAPTAGSRESRLLAVAQSVILERYVPAAALVNARQEILYLFGGTQRYLVQPTGQLTPELLAWSRGGIRSKLRIALRQAIQEKRQATARVLNVNDGESRSVRITIDPLMVPKEVEGCFLVVFEDDPTPAVTSAAAAEPGDDTALGQLEYEVGVLREELRTNAEQFESSAEELKSANEEMMSMNEELQSSNEELETSKEELQSLNEELGTVNAQLENKVQELEAITDDLQNLLSSTHIATIFLDRHFQIKRFTPAMTQLLNLLPGDLKRPIGDFAKKFTDQRLIPDAEQVLLTLQPREAEVRTDTGRWYLRRVLPYRTEDDRIDGVVVTFTDITEQRAADEDRLRIAAIVESAEVAIIGKTLDGTITTWNRGAEMLHGYSASEAIGRSIEFIMPPEHRDQVKGSLGRVARGETVELETVQLHRSGRRLHVLLAVSPVYDPTTGELVGASSIARDITARREAEDEIRRTKDALEARVAEQTRELREANERLLGEIEERRRAEEVRKLLVQRLMTIENDERRRISRELHDQIGQHLAALTLRLKALEPLAPENDGLKAAQQLVDDLGRQVHDLAIDVRPTALDELGLLPALSNYAEQWAERYQVQLDYHARGFDQTRLPPTVEETIYRIVLEALTNVWKHARARRVSLILERRDAEARAIIEDDGVGFDAEELKSADGRRRLGLIGMEERAAMVDGTLTTESRPGAGTTVFFQVPIPPPA